MIGTTEGIVLHHLKYGDQAIIVHILTRDAGLRAYMIHSPRSKRGGLRRSFFQPLQILSFVGQHKEGDKLNRIREVSGITPLHSTGSDVVKSSLAMFMGELLFKVLKEDEAGSELFDILTEKIKEIEQDSCEMAGVPVWILYTLSLHLGFVPNTEKQGDYFDLREGIFCHQCLHPDHLSGINTQIWRTALGQLQRHGSIRLSAQERRLNLDDWMYYFRVQRSGLSEIRSLEVLRDLFH